VPVDDQTRRLGGGGRDADDDVLPVRTTLAGRYEIVDILGKGGMGAVYLAIDSALAGKPVALKVVAHEAADDGDLDQLRREVLLAQQVTHRNVCRIYDLERLDGRWMIKMECISGETLGQRLEAGRLPIGNALTIGRQIAAGLAAAHAEGVIHRDLKPGNVMLENGTGRVVVMDFGIARAAGDAPTSDGAGTPAYMAPEQARGEAIDARADVYALGCVLYSMIIGEDVFPAPSPEIAVLRQMTDPAPDPRNRRPEVPPWLGRAILSMLAKDPLARPKDAAAAERLLAGPKAKRRGLAIVAAVAVAAIAAVIVLLVLRPDPPRPTWHPAIVELEPSYDENAESVAFSPDGKRLVYATDRDRPGWLRARVREVAGTVDDVAISPVDMNALNVSWTQDGQSILFTDASGMVAYRVPATGGVPEQIGSGYALACGAALLRFEQGSPGCASCPRFVLRDDDAREREVLRLDANAFVTTYQCDPAGTRVAWSRAEHGAPFYQPADLWIADLATGKPRRLTDDGKRNAYPTFTPDGETLVFTSARGGGVMNLWELPLDGGAPMQLTFGEGNDLLADVSPDGTMVVFHADVTSAPLFARRDPSRPPSRVTPSRAILVDPQATPDGLEIVATDYAPLTTRIVAVRVADGVIRGLGDGVIATVTADGESVVIGGDGVPAHLSVVARAGGGARALAQLPGRVRALRAGPDGYVHAMVDRGDTREAWRVAIADGKAEREADAPWCFVQPAPVGGWSVWMRCVDTGPVEGVLVAPGARPDPAAPGLRFQGPMYAGGDFDAAGTVYIAYDQPRVLRIDLATGASTTLFEAPAYGMAVSPDGQTVYTTEPVGRARRQMITNFASRPRP